MNILFIGQDSSVFADRSENNTLTLRHASYLSKLSIEVPNSTITCIIYTQKNFNPISPIKNLLYIPIYSPRIQFFPINGYIKLKNYRALPKPDLISVQNPFESGWFGLILKNEFRCPLETQIHTHFFSKYWMNEHPVWNRFRYLLAHQVIEKCDSIRVVSSTIKNSLINIWTVPENKISVIPVPVTLKLSGAHPPRENQLLFVSRLVPSKNIDGLFDIYREVLAILPETKLTIIGDGPLRAKVLSLKSRFEEQSICYRGELGQKELMLEYAKARVLLLPSFYEGFGRVLVESYLLKTPAVATRSGGPEDIVMDGKTGFLVDVDNLTQFTSRTIELLSNPKLSAGMGEAGEKYVRTKFDPDKIIDRIVHNWMKNREK